MEEESTVFIVERREEEIDDVKSIPVHIRIIPHFLFHQDAALDSNRKGVMDLD